MTKTISALQNLLESLFRIQSSAWFAEEGKWRASSQALETYKLISAMWEPIDLKNVKHEFNKSELNLDFSNRVLYLPPMKKDANFVPVLSLSCKLNETQSIAKFRVMLVSLNKKGNPYGIGFRMETPHSQDQAEETPADEEGTGDEDASANEGIHDFYHAQLIKTFQKKLGEKLQINYPSWLPESQPSFPMPAKDPVTLLLCLIVTLYGRECYNQFFDTYVNHYRKSDVKRYKDKLDPWINWNSVQ